MGKIGLGLMGVCSLMLAACHGGKESATNTATPTNAADTVADKAAPKIETAEGYAKALAAAGLPITDIQVVTAASDSNHLLGRPGQYISKVFFYDRRHPKTDGDEGENTIELFANTEDAKNRRDYIANIVKHMPMFTEYQILEGPVLIRLHKIMLPAEADQYQKAIKNIVK